jgi:hypothetical protein
MIGPVKRGELREVLLIRILFVQLLRPLNTGSWDGQRNRLSDGRNLRGGGEAKAGWRKRVTPPSP